MAVIVAVAAGSVGGLLQLRTDTGPESFLPAGDETLASLREAAESFGGDPVVVIAESSEPRAFFGQKQLSRLVRLEGRLAELNDVAAVYGPGTVLNQIAGAAQDMLASLSGHRDGLRKRTRQQALEQGASEQEAEQRAKQAVAKFDRRYGSLLVQGLPAGLPTLHNPGFAQQVIFRDGGAPQPQWDFVVPRPDAVSILIRPRAGMDQAATEQLVAQVRQTVGEAELETERVTVTGVQAVTSALGAQVRAELPLVGGLAVVAIGASYFLVPWLQRRRYRLLPLAATLGAIALVLAGFGWLDRPLSLGVIAFLPILVGIGSDFPAYLSHPGQRRRVLVVALASVAAFASLAVSPLPFVRDLGLALAAGQLFAVGLAVAFRRYWTGTWSAHAIPETGGEPGQTTEGEAGTARAELPESASEHTARSESGRVSRRIRWRPGRRAVTRMGALVVVGAIAAGGWAALAQLEVTAEPDELAAGLPAMEDARHAEQVLGASGEVQILVRGKDVANPQALAWMQQAQDAIVRRHGDQLSPILTPPGLLEFLGAEPSQEQVAAGLQWMPDYLTRAVIRSDQQRAAMSFQLELQDLAEQADLIEQVRATMPQPPNGLEAEVVGLPVAAARGYELVSGDRYVTNGLGLAAAGMVLLVGLSQRTDALRAVAAAALATGWGLAGLWALDLSLTPLTSALGSLTTAIACAYTVMLRQPATHRGLRVARTVSVAALSATLGYLALTASSVAALREFGLVLAGAVALAFTAAHITVRL
ncbi:RND transporter, partial [Haloechinothrix alba]|uniref:RND transporter n=1 Tax=Haloechinothrix alba TaxID=664784 RepID=UPI00113239B1